MESRGMEDGHGEVGARNMGMEMAHKLRRWSMMLFC